MFKQIFWGLSTLLLFSLFSCSGPAESADEVLVEKDSSESVAAEPTQVTWGEIEAGSLKPEEYIVFEAYLADVGSYVDQSYGKMSVPVVGRRNQKAGFKLHVSMSIGSGANQVYELPNEFSPEDFKVVCKDETIVTTGAKVRITGYLEESYTENYVSLRLVQMESVSDDFSEDVFSAAVPLTEEMVHDSTLKSVYCYVDGKFEVPQILFSLTNDNAIDLKSSSVKSLNSIDVRVGSGPGTMDDLPDNYTNKDLHIRDFEGKQIPVGARVRLYGIWERYDFATSNEGKFYLEEIQVQ